MTDKASQIIVALDFPTAREALALTDALAGTGVKFKVGMELFYASGPGIVADVKMRGEVFLDLKLYDIPETMAKTAAVLTGLGAWMFNVHASAGIEALRRVRERVDEAALKSGTAKPLLVGVTVLTSLPDLKHLGATADAAGSALGLAKLTATAGLDGVVCSALEAARIKKDYPNLKCVTPGIRRAEDPADDQARTMTPKEALSSGSDWLVIGRPIAKAKDPRRALQEILNSLSQDG